MALGGHPLVRTFEFMNMPTIGEPTASPPGPPVLDFSEYEPCRTCYLEVYTIFVFENLGGIMFDAILSGGPGGEAPRESRGVWGAAGPPMVGIFMNLKVLTRGGSPLVKYLFFCD